MPTSFEEPTKVWRREIEGLNRWLSLSLLLLLLLLLLSLSLSLLSSSLGDRVLTAVSELEEEGGGVAAVTEEEEEAEERHLRVITALLENTELEEEEKQGNSDVMDVVELGKAVWPNEEEVGVAGGSDSAVFVMARTRSRRIRKAGLRGLDGGGDIGGDGDVVEGGGSVFLRSSLSYPKGYTSRIRLSSGKKH
ncbi:hypothetical protein BDN72DRAFT_861400 [Pluteus cervinus]|uniref:Uncharacterized protein n=1 Tax=Pluteus cervinus TaxID=181527 RepID=A0ACD3AFJ9_9AGAR|nr:hypothetical protein BDN72DRAFT_861400 [Pluteus cervinus]